MSERDKLRDKLFRAALGFEDGVYLFSDVTAGDVRAFLAALSSPVDANAPEGITVREAWDDKATIVNPAWCATEADIVNAKREAASKAWDAAWSYGTNVRMDARDRAALERYLDSEYPAPAPAPDRVTPDEVAYACSRYGYEATDIRALDILRESPQESLAARVGCQP